jgi:beta-lactamase class A
MQTRRNVLAGIAMLASVPLVDRGRAEERNELALQLAELEKKSGGRLGVSIFDTASGRSTSHRGDERFPMCSTFKLLAVAALLREVEQGRQRLDRRIRFEPADVVVNSLITKDRTGGDGMSLSEICEAAMTYSDNTAGNLILANIGGPQGLTSFARHIGDSITRLDRIEPELNEAQPGDLRDTTTPSAMIGNVKALVLGKVLSNPSKSLVEKWLVGNRTGDKRLRAGLPADWRCGDKTGSGERGTTNDIGLIWPPNRKPVIVSILLTGTEAAGEQRNNIMADVGRLIAGAG